MQLVFPEYITYNCINQVIKTAMETYFIEMHNKGKFGKMDKFLYNIVGSGVRSIDILLYATKNAYVGKYKKQYVLEIMSTNRYKNTNYTLSSLLGLINFGSVEVKGTNAIISCYNHIRHYLDILYEIYNRDYRR